MGKLGINQFCQYISKSIQRLGHGLIGKELCNHEEPSTDPPVPIQRQSMMVHTCDPRAASQIQDLWNLLSSNSSQVMISVVSETPSLKVRCSDKGQAPYIGFWYPYTYTTMITHVTPPPSPQKQMYRVVFWKTELSYDSSGSLDCHQLEQLL